MLNLAELYARVLGQELSRSFSELFGQTRAEQLAAVRSLAQLTIERLADSDALYHDAHHTAQVTLVGQTILCGKTLVEHVPPEEWLHTTVALLCHDIGFLRGVVPGDEPGSYVIDAAGNRVSPPRGASDAFLGPYHVERSKLFVRHRLRAWAFLDVERVARAIELTRFPVPTDGDHGETATEAGLVRAADLIGQLGDPYYPRRLNALHHELDEIGVARQLGYESPADVAERYPAFFWSRVEPYVGAALGHLQRTLAGKHWVAQLYANVFVEEHVRKRAGPERGQNPG